MVSLTSADARLQEQLWRRVERKYAPLREPGADGPGYVLEIQTPNQNQTAHFIQFVIFKSQQQLFQSANGTHRMTHCDVERGSKVADQRLFTVAASRRRSEVHEYN